MNRKIGVIIALMLMLALVNTSHAANCIPGQTSWCQLGWYFKWFNVSNVNWNYTNAFGANQSVNWLLIKFNNTAGLGRLDQITVQGYNTGGITVGTVPYIVIANSSSILIHKTSVSGFGWNSITVFYAPTSENIQGSGIVINNISCTYGGSRSNNLLGTAPSTTAPCTQILDNQVFNIFIGNNDHISQCGHQVGQPNLSLLCFPQSSVRLPSALSNTTSPQVNFTTSAPFVVLTSKQMTANSFNITWNSGIQNQYIVNTTSAPSYAVSSKGILGFSTIYNARVFSSSSNLIFPSAMGFGYEGYFSQNPNYTISEGVSTKPCGLFLSATCLYNGIATVSTLSTIIPQQSGYFNLRVSSPTPTFIDIIPAFTTHYNIANNAFPYNNPTPVVNTTGLKNSTLAGWYYDFTNRTLINGLTWQYNTITNNTYPNTMTPEPGTEPSMRFTVSFNNLGYAQLTLPHFKNYGPYCSDMYLRAYNNSTKNDFGSVDFYPVGCSPNNAIFQLLIKNTTSLAFTFNSFFIYTDSVSNFTRFNTFADPQLFRTVYFFSGNILTTGTANGPILLNLSNPLNPFSTISFCAFSCAVQTYFTLTDFNGRYRLRSTSGGPPHDAFDPNFVKNFIIARYPATPASPDVLFEKFMVGQTDGLNDRFWNTTNTLQVGVSSTAGNSWSLILGNTITATAILMASPNFTFGITEHIHNPNGNCINFCLPTLPSQNLGNSSSNPSKVNFTNSTTIPFNGIVSKKTTIANGIVFPTYWLFIFFIIFEIFSVGLFESTKDGHNAVAVMTIGFWFIAFTQWILLIFAIIITLFAIIYEFTPHQKKSTTIMKSR